MFAFDLPKHSMIKVELPTGGEVLMIHLGFGRFVSNLPPLVLVGVSPVENEQVAQLPVVWDSEAIKLDGLHHALFGFDHVGCANSVERAAAAGDERALEMLEKLREADAALAALDALVEAVAK